MCLQAFVQIIRIIVLAILAMAAPPSRPPSNSNIGMSIPLNRRLGLVNEDKSVDFRALKSHIASLESKVWRGTVNYKNSGMEHTFAAKRIGERDGSVPMSDFRSDVWYGSIVVGSPQKIFTVVFDTGSSDFFLPTNLCHTCEGHARWDSGSSLTSKDLDLPFEFKYENGVTVLGELYNDTVYLGGLAAISQTFGAATYYSSQLQHPDFFPDGIMGMGFPSLSDYQIRPVFQTLVAQGKVNNPVFSFKFEEDGGELYLGGTNSELYTDMFTFVDVTKPASARNFWQVTIDDIEVDGEAVLTSLCAIIDTGTSLVVGPPGPVSDLYKVLGGKLESDYGNGFYSFPCDSVPGSVGLSFGGTTFMISALALNIGPVTDHKDETDCVSGIVGKDLSDGLWVIGGVFLKNVYTTFDFLNERVGFALLR